MKPADGPVFVNGYSFGYEIIHGRLGPLEGEMVKSLPGKLPKDWLGYVMWRFA